MKRCGHTLEIGILLLSMCAACSAHAAHAAAETVGFDSSRWVMTSAEASEHLGRECLAGFAYLKDVDLASGIVEVDVAVDGSRSYPGIVFHMRSPRDFEEIYVRPHRAGLYPDAVQYMPVINGIGCWQKTPPTLFGPLIWI